MSKYVISDIHGCYDKFIKMLECIDFKDDDTLYILGDIFDRGPNPIEILDYIVGHKNIHLIKGNHESMFEEFYESGDASLWYYNGGGVTHTSLMSRGYIEYDSIYKYIKSLPYVLVVDKFILVHAGLFYPDNYKELAIDGLIDMQSEETCIWSRSNIGSDHKIEEYTVICGHTPVQTITNNYEEAKILHLNNTIYIDCGCVFEKANGKLACLRLDDMEEFYV